MRSTRRKKYGKQNADRDSQDGKGSGLGLTVARALARRMGGDLTAQSEYGHGSVFTLVLPHIKCSHDAGAQPPESSAGDAVTSRRCLIEDDVLLNLNVLETMLRKIGCRTEKAQSGFEALEKLKAAPFDIILTDMHMPGMDGLELARAIRRQHPAVKIIAVTADTAINTAGFNGVLFKPITFAALNQALTAAASDVTPRA